MHTGDKQSHVNPWPMVNFRPWVGVEYRCAARWGSKLLIVGESLYRQFQFPEQRYTRCVIRAHLRGEAEHRFWTEVARVVSGKSAVTSDDRRAFWRSIAFYNYIQQFVGKKPGDPPPASAWADAGPPFREVLRRLGPTAILVLGFRLWRYMVPPDQTGPQFGRPGVKPKVS